MSEMIERVARAICEAEKMNPDDALGGWQHWQEAARAAIEAMRHPTETMRFVGITNNFGKYADSAWDAMLDEALR